MTSRGGSRVSRVNPRPLPANGAVTRRTAAAGRRVTSRARRTIRVMTGASEWRPSRDQPGRAPPRRRARRCPAASPFPAPSPFPRPGGPRRRCGPSGRGPRSRGSLSRPRNRFRPGSLFRPGTLPPRQSLPPRWTLPPRQSYRPGGRSRLVGRRGLARGHHRLVRPIPRLTLRRHPRVLCRRLRLVEGVRRGTIAGSRDRRGVLRRRTPVSQPAGLLLRRFRACRPARSAESTTHAPHPKGNQQGL